MCFVLSVTPISGLSLMSAVFLFHQSGSEHNLNTSQFQWAPPLCALSSLRDMMTTEEAENSSAALQLVDHTLTKACENE